MRVRSIAEVTGFFRIIVFAKFAFRFGFILGVTRFYLINAFGVVFLNVFRLLAGEFVRSAKM